MIKIIIIIIIIIKNKNKNKNKNENENENENNKQNVFFLKQNIKMSYYWFNRQEILEKEKKRQSC